MSDLTAGVFDAPKEFKPIRGKVASPWKALIYGQPGVGKSSLANQAPGVFFLDLENGLNRIDCWKTPERLLTYEDIVSWMKWAIENPEVKTIAIDTIDEMEKILAAKALALYNEDVRSPVSTLADIPYGRGADLLVSEWRKFIEIIERVVARGKNLLLIGHEQVQKFENPSDANYDFYTVNLHKKAAPVVIAKLDAVLFARFENIVKGAVDNKGKELPKGKAVSTGQRVLVTTQGASWIAKNRMNLEETMPMTGEVFARMS